MTTSGPADVEGSDGARCFPPRNHCITFCALLVEALNGNLTGGRTSGRTAEMGVEAFLVRPGVGGTGVCTSSLEGVGLAVVLGSTVIDRDLITLIVLRRLSYKSSPKENKTNLFLMGSIMILSVFLRFSLTSLAFTVSFPSSPETEAPEGVAVEIMEFVFEFV